MALVNLLRTNDAVVLGLVESLMKEAGIHYFVADRSMSVMESDFSSSAPTIATAAAPSSSARRRLNVMSSLRSSR